MISILGRKDILAALSFVALAATATDYGMSAAIRNRPGIIQFDERVTNSTVWDLLDRKEEPRPRQTIEEVLAANNIIMPEEIASYKAILAEKEGIGRIASRYKNLTDSLLMGVVKREVQGMDYKRRNDTKASGRMQHTYRGDFSFFWEILNEDNKDPYWAKIRRDYKEQLDGIRTELETNNIHVKGRKLQTWENLKNYFKNGSFHLDVEMGALYLDFLIGFFKSTELGLAAYNAGPTNVINHKGMPQFKETINYVNDVKRYEMMFSKLNRRLG